jgi:hypothetical protein
MARRSLGATARPLLPAAARQVGGWPRREVASGRAGGSATQRVAWAAGPWVPCGRGVAVAARRTEAYGVAP